MHTTQALVFSPDTLAEIPEAIATKDALERYAKDGIEPNEGAFHGARLGRQVDVPIAVKANDDGTFTITDGFHRASQAVISDNKNILAFVEGGSGPTLEEIFNKFKAERMGTL